MLTIIEVLAVIVAAVLGARVTANITGIIKRGIFSIFCCNGYGEPRNKKVKYQITLGNFQTIALHLQCFTI